MDTKINYYFNKIIDYLILIKGNDNIYKEDIQHDNNIEFNIKSNIYQLIKDNKDYLLTDSFIYYLVAISLSSSRCFSHEVIEYLERLNMVDDKDVIIWCLFDYVSRLFIKEQDNEYNPLPYFMKEIDNIQEQFTDLEKELYDEVQGYNAIFQVNYRDDGYDNTINNEEVYNIITCIILSAALIHQDSDEFNRLMTNYLEDPIKHTEKLILNGLVRKDNYSNKISFNNLWEPLVSYLISDSCNKRGIL